MNTSPSIVCIGASAGGLEAMEQFFSHVPENCGMSFVVIQHLDPTHQGMLPELLQRVTSMSVVQAGDDMKVKPNWVYVIPPNKDLSISNGKLHLTDPAAARGLRLPIDFFLKALAKDQREKAIGVILSGMGADGSLGLSAIKENAGLAFAQLPASAKFDAMPMNAINTGIIDGIGTPRELWSQIFLCLNRDLQQALTAPSAVLELKSQSALDQIIQQLRKRSGNDFSLYKKNTIYRRIERRMGLHRIDAIGKYVSYLSENPQELDLLFKELLIGVTYFFRDPIIWDYLKKQAIPKLLAEYPKGKDLRVWVPGCSSGEEAYSLAILFKEVLEQSALQHQFKLQIFATDIDQDAIDQARRGFFSKDIKAHVSVDRLKRFFVAEDLGYRINKDIREKVIFAKQNINTDPPFTKLDMLSCRNLLIYFGAELQKKIIKLFHYALTRHGILMLGNSETICNFTALFDPLDSHLRLYQRTDQTMLAREFDFSPQYLASISMNPSENISSKSIVNFQSQVDQLLLQNYSPAAVLVNPEGDILYINGRTGKYLEPAAGKANWNIHAMARDGLRHELIAALNKAQHQAEAVQLQNLVIEGTGIKFRVTVQAINQPEALAGLLIVLFNDMEMLQVKKRSRKTPNQELQSLETDLQQAHEALSLMRQEWQISQEELKSSNEELQSMNEELQSANEELMTSKEEMQSMNEELQTMNAELQSKVIDLSWVNNDMTNLLNSMEIATIFFDKALNIRRFTPYATHLFKLISSDLGRPLSDIVSDLDYPSLTQDTQEVLRSLVFIEKQIKTYDGRWFKVRIMPYRTQENVIDGVVITLIDITETKNLEAELRRLGHER